MKPYQIQRQTKNRAKGLRAGDFLARHFGPLKAETGPDYQDAWPVAVLFHEENTLDKEPEYITGRDVLSWCLSSLAPSPAAYIMIKEAASQGWHIGMKDLGDRDFHLDVPGRVIYFDDQDLMPKAFAGSRYFLNILRVSVIRALRDAWQEIRHGGFDEEYGPEHILLMERVRAADCDVMSILVGWELRSENQPDLWRHIIGSEEGDMAMSFSSHLEKDPSAMFNGKALAAAFKQWFRDDVRVNVCDHETLNYLDEIMREYPVGNPFGNRKPTHIGVEILSCLPDRTAYLRGTGNDILRDPLYAGLQDEINQLHFMQIMRDAKVTYVEGVPFRDTMLAEKIFPEMFSLEKPESIH